MPDQDPSTTAASAPTAPVPPAPSTLTSMIEDNTGGISATRVLMLVWGIGVFGVWAFVTIMGAIHGVYTGISIPESVVTILLGVTVGKVIQRPFEK